MPISKPHSTLGATNTDSCSDLAYYLEKENKELDKIQSKCTIPSDIMSIENRKQFFFSHTETDISTNEVISSIDSNTKKLGKNDAKYFAPTINFSPKELEFILSKVKKKKIKNIWELSSKEYVLFNKYIMAYTRKVMTNYAANFNRKDKGLQTGQDLVYFAKIEHFRKYKGTDSEVKDGVSKSGDEKPGINTHVHVIVSRKDKTQKMKLSPTTKAKSTTRAIGGNTYHVGFDRMKWTQINEESFDRYFQYSRSEKEKFLNQYILKNGSVKEKAAIMAKINKNDKIIKTPQEKNEVKRIVRVENKPEFNKIKRSRGKSM